MVNVIELAVTVAAPMIPACSPPLIVVVTVGSIILALLG